MGRTFQRVVRVTAGPRGTLNAARVFGNTSAGDPGHHVGFASRSGDNGQASECDLVIYNLSDESVGLFEDPQNVVKIQVGYRDYAGWRETPVLRTMFAGNPHPPTLRYAKTGGDWQLTVTIRDGGHAIDYGRVDVSFSTETTVSQIIDEVVRQSGLSRGVIDLNDVQKFRRFMFSGPARDAVSLLVSSAGKGRSWFVRDGAIYAMKKTAATPEQALVISSEKGNLLEAPSRLEEGGVEFRALIDASVRVGRVVKVESKRTPAGFYRVIAIEFKGDNFGGDFSMKIKAVKRG